MKLSILVYFYLFIYCTVAVSIVYLGTSEADCGQAHPIH